MSEYVFEETVDDILDEIRFGNWEYEWELYNEKE